MCYPTHGERKKIKYDKIYDVIKREIEMKDVGKVFKMKNDLCIIILK